MTKIIAIDPGPHCGIATLLEDGRAYSHMVHDQLNKVWDHILEIQPDVVIVERFRTGGIISADGCDTIEIGGSILGLVYAYTKFAHRPCEMVLHTAQMRTPFIKAAKTALGTNSTKIESHRVDALAHLLLYCYTRKIPLLVQDKGEIVGKSIPEEMEQMVRAEIAQGQEVTDAAQS